MTTTSVIHYGFLILSFLVAFFILVMVHEIGHFIFARLFKVKVDVFSIGFGPAVWSRCSQKGTEYRIGIFPLGGYVKLEEKDQVINGKPLYQRFLILIAGAGFNFIFAVIAFCVVFTHGIIYFKPVIGNVIPNSIAAKAHLMPGDEIIALDHQRVYHWAAVSMGLVSRYGDVGTLDITVRDKQGNVEEKIATLNLQAWKLDALRPNPLQSFGIERSKRTDVLIKRQESFFSALKSGVLETYSFTKFNLIILIKMLTGVISWKSLGGPITIIEAAVLAAGQGWVVYLNFLALLSVCVAVINLLPIPGLDGAQIVYVLIEKVSGKPVSANIQLLAFRLGLILLGIIMIQALMNDFMRLFSP